jgi:alkylation response protein AidB-like acyl-CoA dehydrogenase
MDFGLSQEQKLLQETVLRYLESDLPVSRVRRILEAGEPIRETWTALAEVGVAGALVPEEHGGAGLGLLDAALVSEALGFGAAPLPFVGTSVMAAVALREAGTPAQQREWLPAIAKGERLFGAAIPASSGDGAALVVEEGCLRGGPIFALDSGADLFLVAAGHSGLALVPKGAPGLEIRARTAVDRTRHVAEILLDRVEPADWIGGPEGAEGAVERVLDAGRVVLAADTLGACDRALRMAVEYAKSRKQFGRPIGSFQAVKHMCAEMAAAAEPARSLLWYAAYAFDALPAEAPLAIALAKSHLSEVGTEVLRTATEVHGGIGFTDEHDLHLWYKRVELDRQLLGGPALLRRRAARLQGWEAA